MTESGRTIASRLVGVLVGASVAVIPLTLLELVEPLLIPASPLLMTLLKVVLVLLPLPLIFAVSELVFPGDERSVRYAIRTGQVGAVVLLIAALVAWLFLPYITRAGEGVLSKGLILLGAAVCGCFLVHVNMRGSTGCPDPKSHDEA